MTAEPDFHRGLAARLWEPIEGGPEIEYFGRIIDANGGPALDAGCGAGRLLLPWLRRGLDVDGSDVSADMLRICRDKAAAEGFSPTLYEQRLDQLDLPRRYQTIVVCGALGLGTEPDQDQLALERLHRQLEPGGLLALDAEVPWNAAHTWQYWLPAARGRLPYSFPTGETVLADGTRVRSTWTVEALEPLEHLITRHARFEHWRGDELLSSEERRMRERFFFPLQLRLMLERAGFRDIEMKAGYEDRAPTSEDAFVVFLARS